MGESATYGRVWAGRIARHVVVLVQIVSDRKEGRETGRHAADDLGLDSNPCPNDGCPQTSAPVATL